MRFGLLLFWVAAGSMCLGQQGNGIYVGAPKVYDDTFLQSQLDATKASLSGVNPIDQGGLLKSIGATQGANLTTSSFAIQGGSASTASAPPTPAASTLSMPSSMAPSSLDTLNEQMQLKYEMTNLQLLLDGSLSDRFLAGGKGYKKHITIGFPISLEAPQGKEYDNALAEVSVTVCNPVGSQAPEVPPSVITVLPREKTYNVASLTDSSMSFGAGGVIAGVFNVGANFMRGHKTYYLIQQQDTIALQRTAGDKSVCGARAGTSFAWQFRPVLGQKRVRSGLRQTFVQIAFPTSGELDCSATAFIHTAWRHMDPKTGTVAPGDIEETNATPSPPSYEYEIANYDTNPYTRVLTVADVGGGLLAVRVQGELLQGIRARVGPAILDASSPGFLARLDMVQFVAPAKVIVTQGAFLVGRDGHESPVQETETLNVPPLNSCRLTPEARAAAQKHVPFMSGDKPPIIGQVTVAPYSDTASLVTISLIQGGEIFPTGLNPVVVVGNQVYGLSDAPFKSETANEIVVVVPIPSCGLTRSCGCSD